MLDLTGALTTAQAAERLSMTSRELAAFVRAHKDYQPARFGTVAIYSPELCDEIAKAKTRLDSGLCLHCGKPWDGTGLKDGE